MRRIRLWHLAGLALSVPFLMAALPPGCYGGLNPNFVASLGQDAATALAPPLGYVGVLLINKTIHQVEVNLTITQGGTQTTRTIWLDSYDEIVRDTFAVLFGKQFQNASDPFFAAFFAWPVSSIQVSGTVYGAYEWQWLQAPQGAGQSPQIIQVPVQMIVGLTAASLNGPTDFSEGNLIVVEFVAVDSQTGGIVEDLLLQYNLEHPATNINLDLTTQGQLQQAPPAPGAPLSFRASPRVR